MTEQEDASYYQAHREEEGKWGEPISKPRSAKRRLAAMVSVRFSPDEEQVLRKYAEVRGDSLSNFIRTTVLRATGMVEPLNVPGQTRSGTLPVGVRYDKDSAYITEAVFGGPRVEPVPVG